MQARRGEARRRVQGLWVWDRLGHECANAVPSRQRKEVPQMAVLSVRDSGAAMEGHATESVNFNGILVYVQLTQSRNTLRLTKSRLNNVTVWPLRS
jgi:hypothetical protein